MELCCNGSQIGLKIQGMYIRASSSLASSTNFYKIYSKRFYKTRLSGANKTIPDIGNIRTPRCFYVQKTKYMVIRQFSMRSIEWECKEWSMIKTVHLTCLKNGFPNDKLGLMNNYNWTCS